MSYLSLLRNNILDFLEEFSVTGTIITANSGNLLLGWGEKEFSSAPFEIGSVSFFSPDFFLQNKNPWFRHPHTAEMTPCDLTNILRSKRKSEKGPEITFCNPDKVFFENLFVELKQHYFQSGKLVKGVPFTGKQAKVGVTTPILLKSLRKLLSYQEQKKIFLYGSWNNGEGILGGTPEFLFRKSAGNSCRIETVACAGTGSIEEKDVLLSDEKIRREHNWVVEGIVESLSPYGNVLSDNTGIRGFPGLYHLFTPIELQSKDDLSFDLLVDLLHPTAAIGAYPKKEGMNWLKEIHKKFDRHRFGAPFGYIGKNSDEFACYVAIRNMQWNKDMTTITAGCGVTSESDLCTEWKEMILKFATIKSMLGLS